MKLCFLNVSWSLQNKMAASVTNGRRISVRKHRGKVVKRIRTSSKKITIESNNRHLAVAGLLFIFLLMASVLFLSPEFVGFITGVNKTEAVLEINQSFDTSQDYVVDFNHTPTSIKITGRIKGEGTAKVFLSDGENLYLILDKDKLAEQGIEAITGWQWQSKIDGPITGTKH